MRYKRFIHLVLGKYFLEKEASFKLTTLLQFFFTKIWRFAGLTVILIRVHEYYFRSNSAEIGHRFRELIF
jgi:hypothetical protein